MVMRLVNQNQSSTAAPTTARTKEAHVHPTATAALPPATPFVDPDDDPDPGNEDSPLLPPVPVPVPVGKGLSYPGLVSCAGPIPAALNSLCTC